MRDFEQYMNEVIKLTPKPYIDKSDVYVKTFNNMGRKTKNGTKIAGAYVELISFANRVHISELSVPPSKQGSGVGHKAMKIITDLADKFKVALDLFAKPIDQGFDNTKIPKAKLVSFYKQHGFVMQGGRMFREPK
jgi:hypothetical protein